MYDLDKFIYEDGLDSLEPFIKLEPSSKLEPSLEPSRPDSPSVHDYVKYIDGLVADKDTKIKLKQLASQFLYKVGVQHENAKLNESINRALASLKKVEQSRANYE